jgi:hypothetical protein
LLWTALGILYPHNLSDWFRWLVGILFGCVVAFLYYLGAVNVVGEWRVLYQTAFDLYHRKLLLKMVGDENLEVTVKDEKTLWEEISARLNSGVKRIDIPPPKPRLDFPSVKSDEGRVMEVDRGLVLTGEESYKVTLRVGYPKGNSKTAKSMILEDMPPHGYDYLWGSARLDGELLGAHQIKVRPQGPYSFTLPDLEPGKTVSLEYKVVPSSSQSPANSEGS